MFKLMAETSTTNQLIINLKSRTGLERLQQEEGMIIHQDDC